MKKFILERFELEGGDPDPDRDRDRDRD